MSLLNQNGSKSHPQPRGFIGHTLKSLKDRARLPCRIPWSYCKISCVVVGEEPLQGRDSNIINTYKHTYYLLSKIRQKCRNVDYQLRGVNRGIFVLNSLLKWMCIYELAP